MKKNSEQLIDTALSHKDNYLKKELYNRIKEDTYLFEFLQEAVLDGLWFWDLENQENEWMNSKFWTTLGYDPTLMPHKVSAWQDIIYPEDLKMLYVNFEKHLQDPSTPYDQVVRYKHKSGHTVWIRCRGIVLRNDKGIPIRMLGAHTEITDIKETERKLRFKSAFLEQVIEGSRMGTWQWNVKSGEVIFNQQYANIIGYTLEELMPHTMQNWENYVYPKDLKKVKEVMQFHFAQKTEVFECELRMIHKSGKLLWLQERGKVVTWNEHGLPEWVVGSIQEITESKKAYERNRLFIDQAPSALAMFDSQMQYLAASQKWIDTFDIEFKNIIGASHYEVLPQIANKRTQSHKEGLKGKVIKVEEEQIEINEGDVRWFSWEFRPWYTDDEEVGGLIIHASDITKIKREKELQSLLALAEDQNKRLKNFAHIVSHNLKSHSGNFEMLLDLFVQENPEMKNNQIVKLFNTASDHLSETIAHLNYVVQMNSTIDDNLSILNLKESIDKTIESVSALAIEQSVEIENKVAAPIKVLGIEAYLDSILLNFITNGIKYKAPRKKSYVRLYSYQEHNYEVVCVEDNGLGIDLKKHSSKLFGMYKTFHHNENARGIGLFITKNQIEALGGKVEVESEVDKGTIFKIYLKNEKN